MLAATSCCNALELIPEHVTKCSCNTSNRGLMVHVGIGLVLLFAGASLVMSGLAALNHTSSQRFKFDVHVLAPLQSPTVEPISGHADHEIRRLEEISGNNQVQKSSASAADSVPKSISAWTETRWKDDVLTYPNYNATTPKRVALLVFGLQRSLPLTFPSIMKRIIRPLTDVGYEPTIFVHQFDGVSKDKHSQGVEGDWWSFLRPFSHSVTSQKDFIHSHRDEMDACAEHGTAWVYFSAENQQQSVDNLACQLKSVEEVTKLWEAHYVTQPEEYAAVAYIRPDVHYQSNFPVNDILELKEEEVHVPNWGNHMGMNDRFALLHPKTASVWKGRLNHTLQHCLEEPIHSESFVRDFALTSHLKVVKLPLDFVFFRVRPNGGIPDEDYLLPGYDQARMELAERQKAIKQGEVELPPKNANPKRHTWRQTKGSVAGKLQKQHLESLSRAAGALQESALDKLTEYAQQLSVQSSEEVGSNRFENVAKDTTTTQRDISPDSDAWDNSLAVCAIMKDEKVSDIREWLLYHKWLGVDKIYLRENRNETAVSKQYLEAFEQLIDDGFLDLSTWSGQSPEAQQLWYNRCSKSDLAGAQSWILFSDLDEYPVLLNGGVAEEEPDLKGFLKRQRGAAGLTLQWVLFGSSGHKARPTPGGPLRHFGQCSDELSFEMKCLAASHHLSPEPFIHPYFIHACCYNFEEGDDPKSGPPVRYGDGRKKKNLHAKPMYKRDAESEDADHFGLVPLKNSKKCRTYEGHLQVYEYTDKTKSIPQKEALVLFHYMTRSFQDFRDRKLSRYAGRYVDDFKQRRLNATAAGGAAPKDEELFDALEHDLGIDLEAPVCSSAVDAQYASQCCD